MYIEAVLVCSECVITVLSSFLQFYTQLRLIQYYQMG